MPSRCDKKVTVVRLSITAIAIIFTSAAITMGMVPIDAGDDSLSVQIQADTAIYIDKTDSLQIQPDEVLSDTSKVKYHSPALAMWLSCAIPGGGQFYNRDYIKTIIIGGGEIAIIYTITWYHYQYDKARRDGDAAAKIFYEDNRNRWIWILAGTILYSMADAYVDAQLWDYEISRDLSFRLLPIPALTINF